MRDTSFLTLLVIPIFPAPASDHRSSSAKSVGAPRPSICLNLILSHVRNAPAGSAMSLLRLSPIRSHARRKIDRPSARRARGTISRAAIPTRTRLAPAVPRSTRPDVDTPIPPPLHPREESPFPVAKRAAWISFVRKSGKKR